MAVDMNIRLDKFKTIFFINGKVANSSIKQAIKKMEGKPPKPIHTGYNFVKGHYFASRQ